MSASRASLLPEILSRVTAMPVAQIEEDMSIKPNRVFVIPPNSDLTIKSGLLHLAGRTLDRFQRHRSIDTFLISLANDRRSAAISVILSGMNNDGIMGTAAIKKGGGITIAQRVDTALEPTLPRNVITDGWVDFVESPQGIAQLLLQFSRNMGGEEPPP
jgi:two-component system CheB/CheR fusion protein